jgi:tetratricopeptide (TPR) repeat protein
VIKLIRKQLAVFATVVLVASCVFAGSSPEVQKASEAAGHGDWDQVVQLLTPYVQSNQDEAAFSLLGDAYMALGDSAAAVGDYGRALAANAKYPQAVLALSGYYLETGKLADAEKVVATAEAKDPKGKIDEIKVARGRILAKQGDMAEATKILASATQKNPKNPLYPLILARIYGDQKVWPLAADNYSKAWDLAPGDATIGFEYALVLQELKQYDDALKLFKVVQEKDPSNKTVDYLIGRLYYAGKQWAEAATQFKLSADKRPDHFLSFLLLGKSYMEFSKAEKKNFYPSAEDAFRKALALKPERADVRGLLAEALMNKGKMLFLIANQDTANKSPAKYDTSITVLRESLNFDSTAAGVNGQIARAFDKKGMLDTALVYSRAEFAHNPADRNELSRLVSLLQRTKKQQELSELLAPLLADSVNFDKFGIILVNAYIETKQSDKAKTLADQLIAKYPDKCDAHQVRAYIYLSREQYGAAIGPLLEGVKHCPDDKDMWMQLGDSYYFSDSNNKAAVQKALEAYRHAGALGSRDGREKTAQIEQILKQLK